MCCLRVRAFLLICMAVCVAPALAWADWSEFTPRPVENGGFVDVYSSYERDDVRSERYRNRWDDAFVRERFTLFSNGYSYHPRFMQYRLSVSGATSQEWYDSTHIESRSTTGSGVEYDASFYFLPEHPYNLNVYFRRYEPLFKEQAATEHGAVETSRGASFRYRKRPYFVHAGYTDDSVDSSGVTSDVTRLSLDGQYIKLYPNANELSFTGAYNPSWFSNSEGLDGDMTELLGGNLINLKWIRLSSNVSRYWQNQDSPTSTGLNEDQLSVYERLIAYFPYNFRGQLYYRYDDEEATFHDPRGGPDETLTSTGNDLQVDLIHRLFLSVDTIYTFRQNDRTSQGGETDTTSHDLSVEYHKTIPRGMVLIGFNVGRADTDSQGAADVGLEPHPDIAVPGSFLLLQQNVDLTSIRVFLKSPLPPFELVELEPPDYTVETVGNSVEITVVELPSRFVVPGTYEFQVSYSLITADFGMRTDTFGTHESVQLFDDLLTPYFSYLQARSHVTSGTFPGIPPDSDTYTTGLLVHRGPWRARGEYQELDWQISPYRAWRAEVQYTTALNPTTNVYGTATYLNKYYPQGTSFGQGASLTEESETVGGTVQKQFPDRKLFLSVGGSYSHRQGFVDTDAYTAHGALSWKIGKTDLSLGVSAYGSDSSGVFAFTTHREHELVYLKMRRRLF